MEHFDRGHHSGHTDNDQAQSSNQDPQQPYQQFKRRINDPSLQKKFSKVLNNLYLTSANNMTEQNLIEHNVTHIVNATTSVPTNSRYKTHRVNVIDSGSEDIGSHFDAVYDFIIKAMANGGCVVVHCVCGVSRSATLVIAFLMRCRDMTLRQAFDFVRSKRWFIRPNIGFIRQLIAYERKLYNNNTVQLIYHEPTGNYIPDFLLECETNYRFFYLCVKK